MTTDDDAAIRDDPAPDDAVPDDTAAVSLLPRSRGRLFVAGAAAALVVAVIAAFAVSGGGGPSTTDRIIAVVSAPDLSERPFTGEPSGLMLLLAGDGDAVLRGGDVVAPAGTDVYQLWQLTPGEAPRRIEIFRPDDAGNVEVLLDGIVLDPGVRFSISVEPAGGVDIPTGAMTAATA